MLSVLNFFIDLGGQIGDFADFFIVAAALRWVWARRKVRVYLSCGTLVMRACDINPQNLTNVVSKAFFGGDRLPGHVRAEILEICNPWYRVAESPKK